MALFWMSVKLTLLDMFKNSVFSAGFWNVKGKAYLCAEIVHIKFNQMLRTCFFGVDTRVPTFFFVENFKKNFGSWAGVHVCEVEIGGGGLQSVRL